MAIGKITAMAARLQLKVLNELKSTLSTLRCHTHIYKIQILFSIAGKILIPPSLPTN